MPDRRVLSGTFVWFELVSRDLKKAQCFYGDVLGWNARGDDPDAPAPAGRFFWNELHTSDPAKPLQCNGVTSHLASSVPPYWLPYVAVDDTDTTIARARRLAATRFA